MVEKDSPRVKEILKKTAGNPRKRLAMIYDICKSKSVCEGGDELQPSPEVLLKFPLFFQILFGLTYLHFIF